MKKILALLLAMIVCMGCLASCSEEPVVEEGATLAQAVTYLHNLYKDAAKNTPTDYDVVGKLMIGTTEFTVTWETDNELITVKESSKAGFWTVDVPAKTEEEIPYKLTATVKNAQTKTYERIVPIVDNSSIVAEPEEGVAYKFYLVQANLGQTLYATHELQENKFIKSTVDPTEAPDFFAEKVDDGYKFYTMIGDAKNYITASTVTSDDGKVSKYLNYSVDAGSVWYYKTAENAWCTVVEGGEYVVGTYSSYSTFCISESSYINAENSGVSQFPAGLIPKETAEANKPSGDDVVIYETPEEIVNAVYELETGMVLSAAHVYTLTGMIISIDSAYSEQYGNVTVTIVVGDMEDKPIQCYRLKGEGADAIKAGDTITVSGILKNYNGTVEFDAGCTLDSYEAGEGFDVEIYETPEAILNAAYALEVGATLSAGNPYTLTGVITTVDTEFSEQYGNVTVTIVVGDMTDKPIQCFRLKGEGAELIGVGDTVTVTGVIKNYNGKIEFDAGCTLDSYTLTEKPPVDEPDEPSEPDEPVVEGKDILVSHVNCYTWGAYNQMIITGEGQNSTTRLGYDCTWWIAIKVDKVDGVYTVTQIEGNGAAKEMTASADGFILYCYSNDAPSFEAAQAIVVGDVLLNTTVDWSTDVASETAVGTLTFGSAPVEEPSEPDDDSSAGELPPAGDVGVLVFAILGLLAIAGAAVVIRVRH